MIDLGYTKEQMLADIGADAAVPTLDGQRPLDDPRFLTLPAARVLLRANAREDLLPGLNAALSARFAETSPQLLYRDLLAPLKKAVGNAWKRGNQMRPDKWITVELIVTRKGAFLEVADEGAGFDVAGTWARFQQGQKYYSYGGSGFRRFAKAESVISYANGGSTFRACFRTTVA